MNDSHDPQDEASTDRRLHQPLPRELAIAAATLVAIMIAMALALWFVSGGSSDQHGQSNANTTVHTPTNQLLQSLAHDLGPSATPAQLESAVDQWLQQQSRQPVLLASTPLGG